jgi:hypothetical protein
MRQRDREGQKLSGVRNWEAELRKRVYLGHRFTAVYGDAVNEASSLSLCKLQSG